MLKRILLRLPLLDNERLVFSSEDIVQAFEDENLSLALYTASRDLYDAWQSYRRGEFADKERVNRMIKGLYKYLSRACTRATPYGLFAGVSVVELNDKTYIPRHFTDKPIIRLDMGLLFWLYNRMVENKHNRSFMQFYPNDTIYRLNNIIRYAEYTLEGQGRNYQLSEVENNYVLDRILKTSKQGLYLSQIINELNGMGYEDEEAEAYIHQLIDSQILIPEIFPHTVGNHYQYKFLDFLNNNKERLSKETSWGVIESTIRILDNRGIQTNEKILKSEELLSELKSGIRQTELLQIDLLRESEIDMSIHTDVKNSIIKGFEALLKLSSKTSNESDEMKSFKQRFSKKYEDAWVPLLQALDPDIGIEYKIKGESKLENDESQMDIKSMLLDKYIQSQVSNSDHIIIGADDLKLKHSNEANWNLPSYYCAMAQMVSEAGSEYLVINGMMGSGTSNFLGRFSHLDQQITDINKAFFQYDEEWFGNNCIIAEISFTPDGRTGNISNRPKFSQYEITYFSGNPDISEGKIPLSDLWLTNHQQYGIILYSKRLKKIIIPRLSIAHNFSYNALPIYHFLCDMQTMGQLTFLGFHLGDLERRPYIPRVYYENLILSPAAWNINCHKLKEAAKKEKTNILDILKREYKIKKEFYIVEGDNTLYINTDHSLCIEILEDYIRKNSILHFKEFFSNDGKKQNEIIVPFQTPKKYKPRPIELIAPFKDQANKRNYLPFDEWLYFKIYSGHKTMNTILYGQLFKLIKNLKKKKLITKWFFIRFADPQEHIRFRIKFSSLNNPELFQEIFKFTRFIQKNYFITDVSLDTYKKEIERYTAENYELCEDIFELSSNYTIERRIETKLTPNELYDSIAVMDLFVRLFFKENMESMYQFVLALSNSYKAEQNIVKTQADKVNNYYRQIAKNLDEYLISYQDNPLNEIFYSRLSIYMEMLVSNVPKEEGGGVLGSLIHMHCNRWFEKDQRYNEALSYIYLEKYYKTKIALKTTGRAV